MKKGSLFKQALIFLLALTLLLSGCSSQEEAAQQEGNKQVSLENVPERFASGEQVKIKVIRKIGGDDHTAQFLAGAKEEGEAMGFQVDVFTANGDTAKFHDAIAQALEEDYDGFIISHGDDQATVDAVKEIVERGKSVVAFDSIGDLLEIDGVTLTSQDDESLATLALDQLIQDFNGEAKIVYLWVDGFPPMVRRNAVYQEKLSENPGIIEIERFGVAAADTSVQTQNAVAAMLNKHPQGEIDAIFATWDAFAIGAARALKEAGREEIKIYGIDVSNADLQMMQEEGSPWVYTAAVDPKLVGAVNMRILAKKLAGEETPQTYDLEAFLISQEALRTSTEPVNMENLHQVVDGWGQSDAFEEEWMKTLKEYHQ
ncbi:periplasmic binding protein/LacI transcriptional regulator [Caldalkalibacillus thermarum TA2.A1]|uniref:Periplasmic binding protein/LacI transcriptional regulator n=1 Tax=Caldalkalibacillus thermarum (strain TA2.A1) TaxID=986075 RepID=F5L4T7_CALTT|nr:sugar ABC transporter substrate-binding protein [Caldalkalibacillus thermarum]EGL83654.1 periplasmic binding protein/LacI transcriptional regulator [Caldalkalibacillus thermarum TA2.A1]QZT34282.1 sugar ABC transporter substrate-binding protein [Caldalkalibacillus thermarum TA2.A1]